MDNILDLTLDNFQHVIGEVSQQKFVLVNFWAEAAEPSLTLLPIAKSMASHLSEHLVLANVNCDTEQQIAAQFGVRSLPTMVLVKDAQPVDGATGDINEESLKALLEKHLPKVEDGLIVEAQRLIAEGDCTAAYPIAKQAFELNSERVDIRFTFADCCIEQGQVESAKTMLSEVGLVDQDGTYQTLMGKIELAEKAAESPEIKALQAQLESEPDNLGLKVELAIQLHQANKAEDALSLLMSVLIKDLNFGEAKKTTLDMINALPDGEPLKSKYRRKIYGLLY